MKLFAKIRYAIREILTGWKQSRELSKYKRLYPDFEEENEYDCGEYKFVWGVKSSIDMSSAPACLHTMNDIDLIYSRAKKRYILGIETALWFDKKEDEIGYLTFLLDAFTKYMKENNLPTDAPYRFWMSQPSLLFEEETIPEVYTSFKIFVEGYKAVHNAAIPNKTPTIQLL